MFSSRPPLQRLVIPSSPLGIDAVHSPIIMTPRHRTKWRKHLMAASVFAFFGAIILLQKMTPVVRFPGHYVLPEPDAALKSRLQALAASSQYTKCRATELRVQSMSEFAPAKEVLKKLDRLPSRAGATKLGNKFVEIMMKDAPCWGVDRCCPKTTFIRTKNKNDIKAFTAMYQDHELSLLYAIFSNYTPLYILDAGAGAGFSTQLFKLIWPRAVLVSLESDARSYENMELIAREVDGVHAVHAGLWSYHAPLRQRSKKGTYILQEDKRRRSSRFSAAEGEENINQRSLDDVIGVSVNNVKSMFDIPAFDLVYLDIEGAEAVVMNGAGFSSTQSWIFEAKVIAIKLHKKLGKYFGVERRLYEHVLSAFINRDVHVVVDEEHIYFISSEMLQNIPFGSAMEGGEEARVVLDTTTISTSSSNSTHEEEKVDEVAQEEDEKEEGAEDGILLPIAV